MWFKIFSKKVRLIMKYSWPASLESVPEIGKYVKGKALESGLDQKSSLQLCLAVEEIAVNIIHHSSRGEENRIETIIEKTPDSIIIRLLDTGIEFNPLSAPAPDISGDVMEREIGGLGIFLVKKMVDQVNYQRINDQNHLILKKYFQS